MTTFNLIYKDRLECPSNFVPWKCLVQMLLEEHDLWGFVGKLVVAPIDSMLLVDYKRKMAKTMRVIFDSVKDQLIPHIYLSENINQKMLWNNLRVMQMRKIDQCY
jgi:hypothetical protein